MCAERQFGVVGGWRYSVKESSEIGFFVVVRRDVQRDILEDEIAFSYSGEVAEVIAEALVAHERRKVWQRSEDI